NKILHYHVIIADEPTGNLDPDTSWEIMKLLDEINKKGTTLIVATHAKELVDAMKKRVLQLEDGRLVRDEERGVYRCET
ncbi:cell division ATP-binding protein FtsE, partial [Tepidanaerobacter sp. GT38]|nr:cell division ATP-binding protein FtsE [Tepidanaerobacter sp. GT38]